MASLTLVLNSPSLDATALAARFDKPNKHAVLRLLASFLQGINAGHSRAYVTTQVAGAYAAGYIDCDNSDAVNGTDIATIAGTALAVVASPANQGQFAKGATDDAFATNLAAAINAHTTLQKIVRAYAVANRCHIVCKVPGILGNLVTLAETGNGFTLSAAVLAGGASDEADSFAFGYDATIV